jgi:hypothetical protein
VLEQILEQRRDALALRLIADGLDPDEECREPSPDDGPWSLVSFKWVLRRQQECDREWGDQTLADLRQTLLDPAGWTEEG